MATKKTTKKKVTKKKVYTRDQRRHQALIAKQKRK